MKGKIFVASLLVCILSSVLVLGVAAQVGFVGVKAGENFTYSFEVLWSSTNPSVFVPSEFSDMNKTRSIHINVTSASDVFVNVDLSKRMIDGTEVDTQGFINVVTGRALEAQLFIIGANLTAGDTAYPQSDPAAVSAKAAAEPFTIDDTVTRTYLGASRTVNHYTEKVINVTTNNYVDRNAYYDKETGVLMEMTLTQYYADAEETYSQRWRITQFNSAVAPSDGTSDGTDGTGSTGGFPNWVLPAAIVAVVVVVAALLAALLLRKQKNPRYKLLPK